MHERFRNLLSASGHNFLTMTANCLLPMHARNCASVNYDFELDLLFDPLPMWQCPSILFCFNIGSLQSILQCMFRVFFGGGGLHYWEFDPRGTDLFLHWPHRALIPQALIHMRFNPRATHPRMFYPRINGPTTKPPAGINAPRDQCPWNQCPWDQCL